MTPIEDHIIDISVRISDRAEAAKAQVFSDAEWLEKEGGLPNAEDPNELGQAANNLESAAMALDQARQQVIRIAANLVVRAWEISTGISVGSVVNARPAIGPYQHDQQWRVDSIQPSISPASMSVTVRGTVLSEDHRPNGWNTNVILLNPELVI